MWKPGDITSYRMMYYYKLLHHELFITSTGRTIQMRYDNYQLELCTDFFQEETKLEQLQYAIRSFYGQMKGYVAARTKKPNLKHYRMVIE
jgi:hypothetical protein